MLAQVSDAGPLLRGRRHAALLAAAILGTALARASSTHAPLALAFACYGGLHGAALGLSLRPRPVWWRPAAFVPAAAILSGLLARLGLLGVPLLARIGVEAAALLVVAMSGFAGALGYGALLRCLLRYRLAAQLLVMIAVACSVAASAALFLMRRYPVGGSAWLAILWWLAFSAGLSAATAQRARCAPPPADAA
jgi:hypothetical protein